MAWISKNSGSMQIDRRPEPYLTPQMRDELTRTFLPRYEHKAGALLPCLHAVQHAYGWIPPQAMLEIAEFLQLDPGMVLDTASFYEEYWLKPKGKHLVSVCRSIACEFCGQPELSKAIKDYLKIDIGETTDDGTFTLIELECLGSCGTAPAMLVDEKLHENVKLADVPKILEDAKSHHAHH
jgi:NADH:ubiquinone oxidoreductase subunit E